MALTVDHPCQTVPPSAGPFPDTNRTIPKVDRTEELLLLLAEPKASNIIDNIIIAISCTIPYNDNREDATTQSAAH